MGKPCEYTKATHHSKDRISILCGRPEPVILCGYHASDAWIRHALDFTAQKGAK